MSDLRHLARAFRFAVKVRQNERFVDTGSNDRSYATAVLADIRRACGYGTLVKVFVPWDNTDKTKIPDHIQDGAKHLPTGDLIEVLDIDPQDPQYVLTAYGSVRKDDLDFDVDPNTF
jgi:hypothetical protein